MLYINYKQLKKRIEGNYIERIVMGHEWKNSRKQRLKSAGKSSEV